MNASTALLVVVFGVCIVAMIVAWTLVRINKEPPPKIDATAKPQVEDSQ